MRTEEHRGRPSQAAYALSRLRLSQRIVFWAAVVFLVAAAAVLPWSLPTASTLAVVAFAAMAGYGPTWDPQVPGTQLLATSSVVVPQVVAGVLLIAQHGLYQRFAGIFVLVMAGLNLRLSGPGTPVLVLLVPRLRAEQRAIEWADTASEVLGSVQRVTPVVERNAALSAKIRGLEDLVDMAHHTFGGPSPRKEVSLLLVDAARDTAKKAAEVLVHGRAEDLAQITRVQDLSATLEDLEDAVLNFTAARSASRRSGADSRPLPAN